MAANKGKSRTVRKIARKTGKPVKEVKLVSGTDVRDMLKSGALGGVVMLPSDTRELKALVDAMDKAKDEE